MDLEGFWYYIKEREHIRLCRASGWPFPWTADPILQKYKFTNVRRLHDKTTQYFLEKYKAHTESPDYIALYNCGVARYHGTKEFSEWVGWMWEHNDEYLIDTARRMLADGLKVYTGAYIITNGGKVGFKEKIVAGFLHGLWENAFEITDAIEKTLTWHAGYWKMWKLSGFSGSGFMAKEVLQDYILWRKAAGRPDLLDELTWTPVGPGARRGLNRLNGRPVKCQPGAIQMRNEILNIWQEIDPKFREVYHEGLSAHDIQFCLCEYDKYERVRLGEGRPRSLYHPPEVK